MRLWPLSLAIVLTAVYCITHETLAFTPLQAFERKNIRSWYTSLQEITVNAASVLDDNKRNEVEELVRQRAEARWNNDYVTADLIRDRINTIRFPAGYYIRIEDLPRKQGGGSRWEILYDTSDLSVDGPTVLNLAHRALGMAVSASGGNIVVCENELARLVEQAKERLRCWAIVQNQTVRSLNSSQSGMILNQLDELDPRSNHFVKYWNAVENELRGRKPADAAFWFALAGVVDEELFSLLADVCLKEIKRFGERQSCRAKDILSIVDRIAASGIIPSPWFKDAVMNVLSDKEGSMWDKDSLFSLHSEHCALMIWKFSTRQKKQKLFLRTAAMHWERESMKVSECFHRALNDNDVAGLFLDSARSLVVDVGCGMGVSLLGLASIEGDEVWSNCNFIGMDLSPLAIGYAKGITERWDLSHRLSFHVGDAENLLTKLYAYPGLIECVLIQFPTPYRLPDSLNYTSTEFMTNGNSQLPVSADDGFMVTKELLREIANLLDKKGSPSARLIVQSNCEDVAVFIRELACNEIGYTVKEPETDLHYVREAPTQRTLKWVSLGGQRAEGSGWFAEPVLPPKGRTETEIACILERKPVHRCILTLCP